MKIKDAIDWIKSGPIIGKSDYQLACSLFHSEAIERIKLRAGAKKPGTGVVSSVVNEMVTWITKVAIGVGIAKEHIKLLTDVESAKLYGEYGMKSPEFEHAIKQGRIAIAQGKSALLRMTLKDLDAIAAEGLAHLARVFGSLCPFFEDGKMCQYQIAEAKSIEGAIKGNIVFKCTIGNKNDCPMDKRG